MNKRQTVLIVDDDPGIRESLEDLLRETGYATCHAGDGVEAIETILTSSERLVVLLDLMMPRKSGWEVLSTLVTQGDACERHAFIILTANKRAEATVAANANFSAVLTRYGIPMLEKPFDSDGLLQAVEEACQRLGASPAAS